MPQPYERKDSGVTWIGEIPKGWEVRRLKMAARRLSLPAENLNGYIGLENVKSGSGTLVPSAEGENTPEGQAIKIFPGNVIFGKLRPYLAKCYLVKNDGCCSSEFLVLKAEKVMPKFLSYLMLSPAFINEVNIATYGAKMPRANWEIVGGMRIPIPSVSEQSAIAAYLDEQCGAIDQVIAEAKATMEEYKAWKASVIFEAVTKGLNPQAERKDSGVTWIGEIPKGWKVCKTLFGLSMPITDGPHTTPELYDTGIPFISAEAVSCGNGKIDFSHMRGYISEDFYQECCKKYIPQKNDIYMIKSGATTGKVAIVDTETRFTIWSPLAVFRANLNRMVPRYLFYYLQSQAYLKQVEIEWSYGTQQNIGMRVLEQLKICLPPLSEQSAIAAYLDERCGAIDAVMEEKELLIGELEAYKRSLIFEVVTGKRRVW